MGLDKRKDNKERTAPPVASFTSEDEPLIPVCCESDDEFFNNEDLPKKKLNPFSGQYRAIGKKNQEQTDKNKEEDNDTDDEGGKKKTGKDDFEEEDGGEGGKGEQSEEEEDK
jgi:hypothetical protein